MIKTITPIIAILVIGALSAYAISQGINGVAMAVTIGVIAALGGYTAPHKKPKE